MDEAAFFKVIQRGPVVWIAMNRPDKANAMSPAFWEQLPQIMTGLDANPEIRCAVLTGEGSHFSSGMDLATFNSIAALFNQEPARAAHALRKLILTLQDSFTAIERVRFPVIAAIHGACIGGAIDMVTACDLRIASADAFFAVEEVNIGMAADVGTLQRLPKLVAPSIAADLAFTGRRFDAREARSIGLLSAVHDDRDALMHAAEALAVSIAERSPVAMAGIKRNLAFSRDHSVADGLEYIATWNAGMLRAEELLEALGARAGKTVPAFKDMI